MNELGPFFCPYDSVSSFALEPMYLSLRMMPSSKEDVVQQLLEHAYRAFPAGLQYVNYEIKSEKLRILWQMFQPVKVRLGSEFELFCKKNDYWLKD
jgi:4-alpha-glucanotransferase